MSRTTKFTCDGCDREATSDVGLPIDWSHVKVSLDGLPKYLVPGAEEYDLCDYCARILCEKSNPIQWPRATIEAKSSRKAA